MPSRPLPPTAYAILGMLSLAPMSGYELLANVGKTIAHFWTISKSQTYAELARLEGLGLLAGTDVAQEGAPDKRTYTLTDDGVAALEGWLAQPSFGETTTRSHVLLKVFFAYRMPGEVFAAMLETYRQEAEATRAHLASIVDLLEGLPETFYPRATALLGMRTAEATVRWVDEVRSSVPSPRTPPAPATVAEKTARGLLATTPARPKPSSRRRT
jgi:DNA-binding PadR family transcriptional regulator